MRPNLVSSERKIKRPLLVSRSPRERLPFIANLELPVCDDAAVEGRTALTRLPIEPHYRDAELLRLVGQVAADPIAREHEDANRHRLEHLVVALEGRCVLVLGPIGLEHAM